MSAAGQQVPRESLAEQVVKRVGLLKSIIAAVVVLVGGTAGVISAYTLSRVQAVEDRDQLREKQINWLMWTSYRIAEHVGVENVEPPKVPREEP